jgi:hypothetical protein
MAIKTTPARRGVRPAKQVMRSKTFSSEKSAWAYANRATVDGYEVTVFPGSRHRGGEKKMVVHVSVERRYQFERKRGQSNGFDPKKMQSVRRGR